MIYLTVICILIVVLGLAVLYIYRTVDRALTSSETILRLRQEVSEEAFRSADFENALKWLEQKQLQPEPTDWSAVVNPFQTGDNAPARTTPSAAGATPAPAAPAATPTILPVIP